MDVKQMAAGGIGLGYTYPEVLSENGSHVDTNEVSHPVSLPPSIAAGSLLLVLFASDGYIDITFPGGWTQLFHHKHSYFELTFAAFYRGATGGEGATITATTTGAQMSAHTSYHIVNYGGVEVSAIHEGYNATPNPERLTPSWGVRDTLWFGICAYDWNRTITSYPTNYTDGRNDYVDNTQGCGVGSARRKLNAAYEEAGVFGLSVLDQWIAATVGIKP